MEGICLACVRVFAQTTEWPRVSRGFQEDLQSISRGFPEVLQGAQGFGGGSVLTALAMGG